jgi:pyruvate dehydrogenase kinase 2/3/4
VSGFIFCLSLSFLENVGRSANEVRSFEFLRKEIPVRLANIMQEINLLPQNLLRMPSVHLVHNWYVKSFKEILEFEDIKSVDNKKLNELVTISLDFLYKYFI